MLFASLDFLLFFVPVLGGYWFLSTRPTARWSLLLCASYFFYCASARPAYGQSSTPWYFVGLIILSTFLDYFSAQVIENSPRNSLERPLALGISLAGNLGLLGCFKYTEFALEATTDVAHALGLDVRLPSLRLALPIGISFYTFQSLSYTIDVWRGRLRAETSFLRFALFVSFFPQLVAGPIVRASEFLPQLRARLSVSAEDVDFSLFRITKGLLKKVVLGDFIAAQFTDVVFSAPEKYSSLENLLALYAFTLQIYADFSGYSDIAIGVARLMGFRLPENFDRPYQARDVAEFWRRWHMTLSSWLRDYVFFPLGGSRVGEARAYINLWLTMFLVGMWHGASWNFVIYSNLHAAAVVYARFNRTQAAKRDLKQAGWVVAVSGVMASVMGLLGLWVFQLELLEASLLGGVLFVCLASNSLLPRNSPSAWWVIVHVALTFHFTTLSRIFFRANSLDQAREMALKLVRWDFLGVREGMFRYRALHESLSQWGDWARPLVSISDWAVLLLLAFGTALHFAPARWTEVLGMRLVRRTPAPALGVAFGLAALLVARLTAGPRANIYFAF